jgi:methyltransferase (TIGR00027 family)
MDAGTFSRTAIFTAAMRAEHQTTDGARIFVDPLARHALVEEDAEALNRAREPSQRALRLFVALRSRIAEDVALNAIADGARQIVVLGAGLDTFAHRLPPRAGLRRFDLDHPATQAEKRRRFALNAVEPPAHLTYAPCDFERQSLPEALGDSGFDADGRAMFLWLGVVPYLTPPAVEAPLSFIARIRGGADVVFDYSNPSDVQDDSEAKRRHDEMTARVARGGEPFHSHFETADLHQRLVELGFDEIDDWGPRRIAERLGGEPRANDRGGHVLHARRR